MIFRISILAAYVSVAINAGNVFNFDAANSFEKGLFLVAGLAYIADRPRNVRILSILVTELVCILLLGALTPYAAFSWGILLSSLNQVLIIFLFLAGKPVTRDRDALLWIAMLLPIIVAGLGLAYDSLGLHPAFSREFATGVQRFGGSVIPAFLSGMAMCGVYAGANYAVIRNPVYYAVCAIDLGILLLAGGRATLAVCLVVSAFSFYYNRRTTSFTKIVGTALGLVVALVLLAIMWETLSTRVESSGLSGREMMWTYLLSLADQYPWTGIGYGHQFYATPHDLVIKFASAAAHNDYYRLLVELGYVGMPLYYLLFTLAVMLVWASRVGRKDWNIIVCFAGYLALSVTDNVMSAPSYFPLLILSIMVASGNEYDIGRTLPGGGARARRRPILEGSAGV